jgi:hypothetical protein
VLVFIGLGHAFSLALRRDGTRWRRSMRRVPDRVKA